MKLLKVLASEFKSAYNVNRLSQCKTMQIEKNAIIYVCVSLQLIQNNYSWSELSWGFQQEFITILIECQEP